MNVVEFDENTPTKQFNRKQIVVQYYNLKIRNLRWAVGCAQQILILGQNCKTHY